MEEVKPTKRVKGVNQDIHIERSGFVGRDVTGAPLYQTFDIRQYSHDIAIAGIDRYTVRIRVTVKPEAMRAVLRQDMRPYAEARATMSLYDHRTRKTIQKLATGRGGGETASRACENAVCATREKALPVLERIAQLQQCMAS